MELLLGSGAVYNFLADKINTNYPTELLQISSKYEGPVFDGSDMYWYPFKDEVDEAKFNLNQLEHVKDLVFSHVYLCVPQVDDPSNVLSSYGITKLFDDYLIRYCHLIHNVIIYKVKVIIFCEISTNDISFELEIFCNVIRPMVSTALKGTNSSVEYCNTNMLAGRKLEDWWTLSWNWRSK